MVVLTLVVALAGCSETLPLHGDVTFTAEERTEIERGNAFISERIGRAPLEIIWDAPHVDGPCEPLTIQRTEGTGGRQIPRLRCIVIGGNSDRTYLAAVAAHELGHWNGLDHVDSGVMQPENMPLSWCIRSRPMRRREQAASA